VGASTVFSPSGLLENMLLSFPAGQACDIHHTSDHSIMDVGLSVGAAAQEEQLEEHGSWYDNQERSSICADMPIGSPHLFDEGWS
jgi:hypothetical protein